MYKFVIKNIAGAIVYTSINTFYSVDNSNAVFKAQEHGNRFINRRRSINSADHIVQKGNYIDVISV